MELVRAMSDQLVAQAPTEANRNDVFPANPFWMRKLLLELLKSDGVLVAQFFVIACEAGL